MTEETNTGLDAVLDAVEGARRARPGIQYCVEQPAYSEMRSHERVKEVLGEGLVVQGCAYGERRSSKPYRMWLSPETARVFKPILPTDAESQCATCKAGKTVHEQGYCPKKGSSQKRVKIDGKSVQAARNRVPPDLAAHVGRAMLQAWRECRAGKGA